MRFIKETRHYFAAMVSKVSDSKLFIVGLVLGFFISYGFTSFVADVVQTLANNQ